MYASFQNMIVASILCTHQAVADKFGIKFSDMCETDNTCRLSGHGADSELRLEATGQTPNLRDINVALQDSS